MEFTGNEKFTAEFTSEELGFFALGLQALVQTMQMAAFKSNDVQVYDHFKQTQEKADALAQKIADIMELTSRRNPSEIYK